MKEKNGLYLAYKTVLEMADARNFRVNNELTREQFIVKISSESDKSSSMFKIDTFNSNDSSKNEQICIVFIIKSKRSEKRTKISTLLPEKFNGQLIVVLKDKPQKTGTLKTSLKGEQEKYNTPSSKITRVDVFSYMSLLFNITKHVLQPQFDMVNDHDLKELVKSYTTKDDSNVIKEFKTRLPKLMYTDPIAEFYGMNIGDVIKVTRYDPQYNSAVTYRVVI